MTPTPLELKKILIARGFEIYRTLPDQVVIAERVRDNLIMDSGVAARTAASLGVRFITRAQASDFPTAKPEDLFERARACAADARQRGYEESGTAAVPVRDPGDPSTTLDTWYEVSFERAVADEEELVAELTYALALDKTVAREHAG
jgi:hypothetical protein